MTDAALSKQVERLARREALRELLTEWDEQFGPVDGAAQADAVAAFDELDAIAAPSA